MPIAQKKRRWYLLTAAMILLPVLFARGISILNSFTATDIRYMDTVWPTVLYYLRQLFTVLGIGAAVSAISAGIFRFGGKSGTAVFWLYAGILLADTAAAFLIDAVSGAVSGGRLPVALLSCLGNWLFGAVLVLLVRLVSGRCAKRGKTPSRAVLWSAVFCMAGRLALESVYLLQFLVEVEFLPYATEMVVIAGEYLGIVFFYGGIVWLTACALLPWLLAAGTKPEKP